MDNITHSLIGLVIGAALALALYAAVDNAIRRHPKLGRAAASETVFKVGPVSRAQDRRGTR